MQGVEFSMADQTSPKQAKKSNLRQRGILNLLGENCWKRSGKGDFRIKVCTQGMPFDDRSAHGFSFKNSSWWKNTWNNIEVVWQRLMHEQMPKFLHPWKWNICVRERKLQWIIFMLFLKPEHWILDLMVYVKKPACLRVKKGKWSAFRKIAFAICFNSC